MFDISTAVMLINPLDKLACAMVTSPFLMDAKGVSDFFNYFDLELQFENRRAVPETYLGLVTHDGNFYYYSLEANYV